MRFLLILLLLGGVAFYTVPTQEAHETEARAFLQNYQTNEQAAFSIDQIAAYVQGMIAGGGRYENFYVASKYAVDLPGAAYLECYGAFTVVRCSEVAPAS